MGSGVGLKYQDIFPSALPLIKVKRSTQID
jgi:hypothetical protein